MKVTNWRKKLAAAIVAAGIWTPGLANAVNINVPDADFESYQVATYVPGAPPDGYAYSNLYRPGNASPWVDDLSSPDPPGPGIYFEDDGASNWLYSSQYGQDGPPYRGAPRSGNQAMHGAYHYNAQRLSSLFEANTLYTFSALAQGDNDAVNTGAHNQVALYLFDGDAAFSEATSLKFKTFQGGPSGDFNNRAGSDATASFNNWIKLNISYGIPASSPLIGHRIGVGFYLGNDVAIDDASLTSVPEPTTMILVGMGGISLLGRRRRRS